MSQDLTVDRPSLGDVAVLVYAEKFPAEFHELALAAGANIVGQFTFSRQIPDPKYYIGRGKLQDIKTCVAQQQVDVVLFDHVLTPAQERNLERELQCRVLDRTGLILDIFAQRARSFEGKLQVELAQLRHRATRLVRGWTHLERQKGGIGLRGPGETQLETDRRLLRQRIKTINQRLQKVRKQRQLGRQARRRADAATISLVGYTNAGKSTLFKYLTTADVYVADQLFATLDPTLRRIELPNFGNAIIADTVGFIRQLPPELIKAFQATLEETCEANLLVHVIDTSDPEREQHIHEVEQVLKQIDAQQIPCIRVYNKIDLLDDVKPHHTLDSNGNIAQVWLSANTGDGIATLQQAIVQQLQASTIDTEIVLTPDQGRLRAKLYAAGAVLDEAIDEHGQHHLHIHLPEREYQKFISKYSHALK